MLESRLSRQVYVFEKSFNYDISEFKSVKEIKTLDLKVELIVDFIEDKFYIDFNQPFHVETGILMVYGGNTIGNVGDKIKVSSEFYRWIANICDFADEKLKLEQIPYDILDDKEVIDIAMKFHTFICKRLPLKGDNEELIWNDFKRYLNPKKSYVKEKTGRSYDSESFDLDDNK